MENTTFLIGIDLGTTNSTLAYAKKGDSEIQQFSFPQILHPGEQGELLQFPSFIYLPLDEEIQSKSLSPTWKSSAHYCFGHYAKKRAAECPDRVISSAKSWLCHHEIDRRKALLPLKFAQDKEKISPLQAISELLLHIKETWEEKTKVSFQDQEVCITVPASFDPGARTFVMEAAEAAGYPSPVLLEEPQAAFYAWLHSKGDLWRKELFVGDKVLVVDIGGGTTDFSLIDVQDEAGTLSLQRIAVGAHLLLGGDNIDYALAYHLKDKLEEEGYEVDDWRLHQLKAAAAEAKEAFFTNAKYKSHQITLAGRGSKLIGGAINVSLSRKETEEILLDGFFPNIPFSEKAKKERAIGMQEIGLPFATDARITAQLASFLETTGCLPTVVLFNGGTMKAEPFRNRILEVLHRWSLEVGAKAPREISEADYDFAVSRGACSYGFARSGKGIRIRSSLSRNYYIGVEEPIPAVPGREPPLKAVLVAPKGMEEGTEQTVPHETFALTIGEKVLFRFFCQTASQGETRIGDVVKNWKKELTELHPLETLLDKEGDEGKHAYVNLKARFTELGMLELWCEGNKSKRWKLEFDLRKEEKVLH
jgi:hypothetical protein